MAGAGENASYDLVLRGGIVYDGSGAPPIAADLAMTGDAIAAVGSVGDARGRVDIDVAGLAVAPGFINMLSWAAEPLLADGRSQSDIRQGVTLEVFGEGVSLGPLSETMKLEQRERQGDITYDVTWTTLAEGLEHLVGRGVSCNVGSFVGATTLRIHEVGHADRPPSADELHRMRALAHEAMKAGAFGVGSSLIYAPACYAGTDELIALAEVAAEHGGMYVSHIRNEGQRLIEALDEFLSISDRSGAPAEIWHFKAAAPANWQKFDTAIARIDAARAKGMRITADMYTYAASSTGLDATMPGWVQEGGHRAWVDRLKDPGVRTRLRHEMSAGQAGNEFLNAERILLVGFRNPTLRHLTGRSLADVAAMRGTSPEDTIMDLVVEDDSRVGSVFFTMSEDNLRKAIERPWVSFCSDSGSLAPEGVFLNSGTHPRAYGSFARLFAKYVRDERTIPLTEAVRRLTGLPAHTLGLDRRGRLVPGYYADVVVFDPDTIQDHATYERPHQYATGVAHVFVNGTHVLRDGEHTGATPGRVVKGPGARR
ncbi:MAG: N-acyl-D-amino-acid deacylase family protein [Chloroflexota bacterium]